MRGAPAPRGGPGQAALCVLLAALLVAVPRPALALGPFEKSHPRVQDGLDAYEEGRYEDALGAFEDARRELPDNPVVEFDRGNALYKLKRLDEARDAYHRVTELDHGTLRQKDYYNLGNALAELGQNADAVAAYRKALVLDPGDDQARHNLEVVLRNIPPPKPKQPQPDAGQDAGQDAGRDAGQDGGDQDKGDAGPQDGGRGGGDGGMDGGRGQGGQDGGQQNQGGDGGVDGGGTQPRENKPADGGSSPEDDEGEKGQGWDAGMDGKAPELNKKDVERLLDSMKQSEKNLQLWRFQQRKKSPRKDNAKDW
jgi:tetratricopeptide (TPR) repeat protein